MASPAELQAMRRAFDLALNGRNRTFPNPLVGAVVLSHRGSVVGEGFHEKCGGDHAETAALAEAGSAAVGGTLVVSLEPCCHYGRTGPCTKAVIGAGISRVVVSVEDPNPNICGRGCNELLSAGIDVEADVLRDEGMEINMVYFHFMRTGRSWLTLKMAVSADGRIAAPDGTSRWITCEESRTRVHELRASSHAVMTGAGTARKDDPGLNVRLSHHESIQQPARIVVTSSGDLESLSRIFTGSGRVIIACPEGVNVKLNEEVKLFSDIWRIPHGDTGDGLSLPLLLRRTASEGYGTVICESGPMLATGFLQQKLVNSLVVFSAPMILGDQGIPCVGDLGIETLEEALRMRNVNVYSCGSDCVMEGDIVYGADSG